MEKDPSEIRREIEVTRERMGDTVEALAYKTDVPARAKDAVTDRVESVKAAVSEAVDTARTTLGGAAQTAQSKFADMGEEARPHLADLRESVGAAAVGARDAAVDASRNLPTKDDARAAIGSAKGIIADNPLGLALGSVAIGILLGALLPVSRLERDQIGPIGEQLADTAQGAANEIVSQGKTAVTQVVSDAFSGKSGSPAST